MNISYLNLTHNVNNSFLHNESTNLTNSNFRSLPPPEYTQLQWLFALLMVIVMIDAPLAMIIYVFCQKTNNYCCCKAPMSRRRCTMSTYCRKYLLIMLGVFSLAFALWFLLAFYLMLWDEIIRFNEYELTSMLVTDKQFNPYRCCDIVSCTCSEAYNVDTCSSMKARKVEGQCGNGYDCCLERSYDCNCVETCDKSGCTESCSTCTECLIDVFNELCQVKCGTCYTPTVYVEFNVTEPNNTYNEHSSLSKSCSRDQYSCAKNYLDSFVDIGQVFNGYYNPYDTKKIDITNLYSVKSMAITLVPVGIYLILITIMIVFSINCRCHWFVNTFKTVSDSVRINVKKYMKRIKKTILGKPLLSEAV